MRFSCLYCRKNSERSILLITTRVWITAKVNYAIEVRSINRMVTVLINAMRTIIDNWPNIEE